MQLDKPIFGYSKPHPITEVWWIHVPQLGWQYQTVSQSAAEEGAAALALGLKANVYVYFRGKTIHEFLGATNENHVPSAG